MKTSFNKLLITMAVTAATSGAMVNAAEPGRINFEGAVTDTPCGISADSLNQNVNLGQIGLENLNAGGQSERQEFEIELVNCQISNEDGAQNKVSISFNGRTAQGKTDELLTRGDAGDVVVKMFTDSEEPVEMDTAIESNFGAGEDSWMNTLHFYAIAAKSDGGTVTEGDFNTEATFTLTYQ
ncbi:fimbrial protein [Vibrio sagamiensis]|uniref:Major pilin protein PapA n=1 Tax=Vibrio sagamiensis NBRC 104589 TaxID=1219064 RepID=A0A511QH04_9VIBR|nr:fimbrial protein [Vibrio sagamiensis]PNQ53780.1 type 1 fimbrial protein [Vibrio agarivorans]GEM76568.1 major pilin protein PapA [Vibrio sagamiensis NBRC 104589]